MWTERPVRLLGLVAAGVLLSGVAACGGDTGGEEQLDISGSGDETTPGTADPPDSSSASTPPAGAPEVRPAPEKGKTAPDEYGTWVLPRRSEEHTSELQSRGHLVCRLLLEIRNMNGPRPT